MLGNHRGRRPRGALLRAVPQQRATGSVPVVRTRATDSPPDSTPPTPARRPADRVALQLMTPPTQLLGDASHSARIAPLAQLLGDDVPRVDMSDVTAPHSARTAPLAQAQSRLPLPPMPALLMQDPPAPPPGPADPKLARLSAELLGLRAQNQSLRADMAQLARSHVPVYGIVAPGVDVLPAFEEVPDSYNEYQDDPERDDEYGVLARFAAGTQVRLWYPQSKGADGAVYMRVHDVDTETAEVLTGLVPVYVPGSGRLVQDFSTNPS